MQLDFENFLVRSEVGTLRRSFESALELRCSPKRHGDLPTWLGFLDNLPELSTAHRCYSSSIVSVGMAEEADQDQKRLLEDNLRALSPWRKGPYQLFGTYIDTEWRSDLKWDRLKPHISPLAGKRVLDVGCGTGYHCWRMLGDGAEWVVGIDPSMRFVVQNFAIQKYAQEPKFDFIPIGIEDMPSDWPVFESVFSMGVLYHRRNPINHLFELKALLAAGGELVLETLIVDPDTPEVKNGVLRPEGRYAMMRNVWSLLTQDKVIELLTESGFQNARCVDINITSTTEQRSTDWMTFHSLSNFLDSNDPSLTIEGYPAPKRAIFIANL